MCGNEGQRTDGIEPQTDDDAPFVVELLDEHGGRECQAEVSQIKHYRNQRGLGGADAEYLGEGIYHRCRYVVGKSPQGKAGGNEHPRRQVFLVLNMEKIFCNHCIR